MRKEYEERLEALAESKRQALREMNDMFETKLEEKDLMLQEVPKYYRDFAYPTYNFIRVQRPA